MHDVVFAVAGFVAGPVVGLTGVGDGSLMTPILISQLMRKTPQRVIRSLLSVLLPYAGVKLIST